MKIEVHHRSGIAWERIIDEVFKEILCDPSLMEVLCKECHKLETNG